MREPKSYQQMVDDWNAGVGTSTYETDRMRRELSGLPTEPPTTVYPPPNIVPVGRILTAAEHAAIWRKVGENLKREPRATEWGSAPIDFIRSGISEAVSGLCLEVADAYEAAAKEERG